MKYKGIELKRFHSDKPVTFDPPKKMVVWNSVEGESSLTIDDVIAYIPIRDFHGRKSVICKLDLYGNCAEIPEEPKSPRVTKQEFARWIAQGNGEWKEQYGDYVFVHGDSYKESEAKEPCSEKIVVRKWGDTDWHEPTAEYMDMSDADGTIDEENV